MRPDLPFPRHSIVALLIVGLAAEPTGAQQTGRDTTRARADSTARRDSATAGDSLLTRLFGPDSDLGLQFNGRFEFRTERTRNERCVASQFLTLGAQCTASFQPVPDFQFGLRTGGSVGERFATDVDYDSRREFDGSNRIGISYTGREKEWLRRVDVGNVTFDVPASRFVTSGIPQGNYGIQAAAQFGRLTVRAIAAEQKGIVQRDRVFTVGGSGAQAGTLEIDDYQVEARRFFFTVDPRRLAGYPNIDILDGPRLAQLAAQLPDSVRPARVSLYRQVIGGQPPNPNGPQFRLIGDPSSRAGAIYEPLRENVDFYADPSQLWVVLAQPLDPNRERLVVAYSVRVGGRDTVVATTGGTPDVARVAGRDQFAVLLWDPNVRPGDDAFHREIRAAYRVGGEEVRRESVRLTIAAGGTFDQERPTAGRAATFLEHFGLARIGTPTDFDAEGRVFPRRGDPIMALAGAASSSVIRERFVIFPSLHPFARAGLAGTDGNPANDAIYTTPNEDLYSPLHPQPAYRLRLAFEADAGLDAASIALGSTQVRPLSERLVLDDGTVLRRDVDYVVDYDLGRVTLLRSDSVYSRPRQVTVRFEETPLFVTTPTTVFGLASRLALPRGELHFVAIGQRQHSSFTRPELGYADEAAIVAGVSGSYAFPLPALERAARRLVPSTAAPSQLRLEAEFATSRPQPGGSGEAYLASFESDGAFAVSLADPAWYYSSQPALGRSLPARIGGAATLDLARAATLAWQTNGLTSGDSVPRFTLQEIDPLTKLAGTGITQPEQVLWMTLYPLSVGGAYDARTARHRWTIGGAAPGRRWRSIRQVLGSASGVNLTGKESVEFWALVDTAAVRRRRNPTIVVDLGDVSENGVAVVPTTLVVSGGGSDSTWSGRAVVGGDTLQSERDPFSRTFNQEVNDVGLPGDIVPRLLVTSPTGGGIATNVAMCARGNLQVARLGDTRTNCTVGNGRLDEWDIDGDNVLNFDAGQRERERVFRYVADLADPSTWTRVGGCRQSPNDPAGPAAPRLCWVLVRMPFAAPTDTIGGGPSVQRVRAMRLTMVSGDGLGDSEFSQVVLARMRLVGASWLKRSDRTIPGLAGEGRGGGFVFAGVVGTQDSLSALGYQSPPGVVDEADRRLTGLENTRIIVNERSLRLTATSMAPLERAEAFYKFPEGARSFRQYRELRLWARGRGNGWGPSGDLQMFVKIGRDPNSFYAYRTPANAGASQAAWLPEVRVDFERLYALRAQLENSWLQHRPDSLACSGADLALIQQSVPPVGQLSQRRAACRDGYIVYAADPGVSPPNLSSVQELAVGFVRMPAIGGGPTMPGDTLELWVDDIRLAGVVSTPGYAGMAAAQVNLGDIAQVRVAASRRDPNFRQLAEAPTYLDDQQVELAATLRLDQLIGGAGGWALPLTATVTQGRSAPEFLTRSDLRASSITGVRTPEQRRTSVTLGARRVTPLTGAWYGLFVNHLSANAALGSSAARTEFSTADQGSWGAGFDYVVGGTSPAGEMPGWWASAFDRLPRWLGGSELFQAMRNARPRLQPAEFRTSGAYDARDESRASFLGVATSPTDTGRTVDGTVSAWRTTSAVELRPFDAVRARWEASSTRDLVRYGDSTATAVAASAERDRYLGVDAGLERERALTTLYEVAPRLEGAWRPRASLTTSYGHFRDPNARVLLREGDTTGALRLPRRVNAAQVASGALAVDVARLASRWTSDSAARAFLMRTIGPVEATVTRTISSSFDGTPRNPGLAMQLGWGGEGTFLESNGVAATAATSNTQVALASSLRLPLGVTLDARTQRMAMRNWLRKPDRSMLVVDGELVTLPELGMRATFRPRAIDGVVSSVTTSARLVATAQRTRIPVAAGSAVDARVARALSSPVSVSVAWNDPGALVTGFSVATTQRVDSVPGSRTEAVSRDIAADVSRTFRLPREWELKSDLRTRLAWQRTTTSSWVETLGAFGGARSRIADNGRDAINFNADTDVAENLTFSLQGARIVTFDRNLNRRISQIVLSAVLQISFFAGELR